MGKRDDDSGIETDGMKTGNKAPSAGGDAHPEDSGDRSAAHSRRIGELERRETLRSKTLAKLAEASLSTTELAAALPAPSQSVSRVVSALRREHLVETRRIPADGRGRVHFLTHGGELELSRHRAYGEPEPPPPAPSNDERIEYFHAALLAGVRLRRQRNDLEGGAIRFSRILRQARELDDGMLVVEAINELATTLRQCRAPEEQVRGLLDELEEIALGKKEKPLDDPTLVLPALAHREYALGRLGDGVGEKMLKRAEHLRQANSLYGQLAAAPRYFGSSRWRERQAWSQIALARNLRARSEFEEALERAAEALQLFDEIDDPYGRSNGLFSVGVCLRLLGAYDQSMICLDEARALANRNSFARFEAESLTQKGEVLRCRGDLAGAREALFASIEQCKPMNLEVTHAFALSALGAVAFHQQELDVALHDLGVAQERFANLRHREGMALTARRQAAVARHLLGASGVADEVERSINFSRACYRALHSPAGVVACEVEHGRLQIRLTGEAPDTVKELLDLIDNRPDERSWVELDPWVPSMICEFAAETEDEHFRERCESLLEAGKAKLRDRAEKAVGKVAAMLGDKVGGDPAVEFDPEPDEMGGEARQRGNQSTEQLAPA